MPLTVAEWGTLAKRIDPYLSLMRSFLKFGRSRNHNARRIPKGDGGREMQGARLVARGLYTAKIRRRLDQNETLPAFQFDDLVVVTTGYT